MQDFPTAHLTRAAAALEHLAQEHAACVAAHATDSWAEWHRNEYARTIRVASDFRRAVLQREAEERAAA